MQTLVGNAETRTRTPSVVSHTWAELPDGSVADAGMGFLVSTPEFCFLQLASRLSLAHLMQVGFELCGTYALAEDGPAKQRKEPLTSVGELKSFIESAPNAYGRAKALRAVRYLMDGSASPMETVLAMLLCLPYKLGGYAIPRPALNYRVDVPPSMRKLADRSFCVCDLCWPAAKLSVEYDSKRYHTDPERQDSDARRRNMLIALGYTVVTASWNQVTDGGAFNRLAQQVAKRTGKRLRYVDPAFTRKHIALRDELLESLHRSAEDGL